RTVHRKYVYRYNAEGRNVAPGSASLQNGPKVTCEVEIEVPQTCRFIIHTRDCTVNTKEKKSDETEMLLCAETQVSSSRSPLKVSVHSNGRVEVYPEADESINILNVKRGIISAFLFPVVEDGWTGLSTVHGRCLTTVTVHSRQDVTTDASASRDLSQCDQFYGRTLTSSPVALLQQMHNPVSKLISSTQSCRYQFDNRGTHITIAKCTEKHRYLPFSKNGISSTVTQDLSLQNVKRTSSRRFGELLFLKLLWIFIQMKDAVLGTLQELVALASTDQGQKRTSLFHKLVSSLRVLRNETLSQTVAEMVQVSNWLTFQALFQCGTSECTSAIMQVIWTTDRVSLEVDALVYALALQPNPDAARVRDMLSMAQYKQSKAIMFALANTITEVSKFMETILNDCSEEIRDPDRDPVVGVMGRAMQDASPSLIFSILRCMRKPDVPLSNQKAAIQAFRLMDITAEIRRSLLETYQDPQSPADRRLAAYLVLMKDPDSGLIREICSGLLDEKDGQLKSFVLSHLKNIQNSGDKKPEELIGAALQDKPSSTNTMFNGLSKNYMLSSPLGSVQSNVIFDSGDTLPKEIKLEASLKAYDRSVDMFEVGLEGAGFEPTVEALFGEKGFLLESFSRLMKFVGDRAPMLRGVLDRIAPGPGRKRRQVAATVGVIVSAAPEATAFLRLLGDEIGYMKMSEMRKMFKTLFMYYHVFIRELPAQVRLMFLHYVFMETSFSLPTASGFPLKFSLSGVFAAGARGGLTPSTTGMSFMPSGGLEFITHMGVHLPDYVEAGTEMLTNLYHESSFQAKVTQLKFFLWLVFWCSFSLLLTQWLQETHIYLILPSIKFYTDKLRKSNFFLHLGEEPTEATASVNYNQNENTFSAELLIPACDVEATVSLAVTRMDGDGRKTRHFSIDVTNRNVTLFSLAGRARSVPENSAGNQCSAVHGALLQASILFRYQFNKEKAIISLPLPLGGNTSEELNLPKTLSFPVIELPQIGLYIPAKNFVLPSFRVPTSLDLSIPLLGLAEASAKIHSNLYSWEGSISGGNSTVDIPSYIARYKAMAQSPIRLLSYELEGVGMISGRAEDNLKYLLNCSFSHIFIDSSFSITETLRVTEKLNAQANYKLEAFSPLGLQTSLHYSAQSTSTLNSDEVSGDGDLTGLLKIASFHTNTSYSHSYNLRPLAREGRGESILRFDSPFIQFQNVIRGLYANSELNIVSKTSTQRDVFKHVAELKYKDAQLSLKCSAVGLALGKSLNNIVELGVSSRMLIIRIESQADDDNSRVYSLITGSLGSNGLEVNSEGSLTFEVGRALHKASVRAGRDGLSFSGINNIQCSPVTVENIFDGAIDVNGASYSSSTKVMAEEGRGELGFGGKITPSEASLYGDLKGHAYDAATANSINVVLNRRALTFSGNMKGTLRQMLTENSHKLTLTLWTLSLRSKMENFICEDLYYRQNFKVDAKPFILGVDINNKLRFYDLNLDKEDHMKLEPLKADLRGTLTGAFREEENIKHTYELTYKDWSGSMKYSTSGNIMDAHLNHSCELEFAGLSSNSKCEAKLSSEPLRFSGYLHIQALPFSLAIDSSMDSAGELNLHGKHSGQLFSTLLVKTTPLALGWSHDCRVSTTHRLPARESLTSFSNKFEGLLTPKDQSLDWKVNSKVNNHAYEQSINAYNNPEKVGLELSGVALTDLLSRYEGSKPEPQTFTMAGFLKYDKNSDCHIIEIPFIESFPEHFKMTVIRALESLRQLIENANINQIITDFRANLDQLPIRVKRFMRNLDLENKVGKIKERLDYLINEFTVTMDDLELGVTNMRQILEKNIVDIVTKVHDFISSSEDYINAGHLTDKITTIFSYIGDQLHAFDAKYQIKPWLVRTLDFMEDVIRQMDLQKLRESSAAFLHDLDIKYDILETIREKLSELKNNLEDFNLSQFVEVVKNFLLSFDWDSYVQQLSYQIPVLEIARVMESMNEVIINWFDEYEIPNKLNTVYSYCKDTLLKYEIDNIFKDLMDQAVVLIREWKIEETVQSIVTALKSIKLEIIYNKMMDCLNSVIDKMREIDFKNSIDDFNECISSIVESMKDFDYSSFVDESNIKIVELTDYLNNEINKYEIVKKIEAVRQFFREIQNSIYTYLDELKNTKVADALKKVKDVIDTAFYNDVKLKVQDILEDMRQRILDMDIRDEIQVYLQRASDSYRNIVTFFSAHFDGLMEWMKTMASDKVVDQMKQAMEGVLDQIKRADIEVSTFTVPFTDLEIPGFTINLNKLQEITIPAQISVPEFTILSSCTIPAFVIDLNKIKTKIVAIIDDIRGFQIQMPDLEDIFGNLKVLYLSELPDITFPDIVLTEIKFPAISIPKLNLQDSGMEMLTNPDVTFPEIPTDICFLVFGKLHGEFSLSFPKYVLINKFKIENSTTDLSNPKFTAIFTSHAKSPVKVLEHIFEVETQLEAPRMESLQFTQTLKATHVAFSVDHEGSLALLGSPEESFAKSTTIVTTQFYTADLVGSVVLSLESGVSAVIETSYNHKLDIPTLEASSQASLKQSMTAKMDPFGVTVTGETSGTGKWSIQDFFDEGTHRTNVELKVDFNTAKLTCVGDIDYQALKSKHTLTVESALLSHIAVKAQCESKTPFAKTSILFLKGEADVADLNAALIVSHEAELTGGLAGTMSNSWEFRAQPFEIIVDVKNKVNSKVLLPLKLTGKVDLENDYGVVINSERQSTCWFALVRFNQYKYSHNLTAENDEKNIYLQSRAEGEANLEFLTIPLSIPEMTLSYFQIQTPGLRDFSLWEDGGLKSWLINPQQLFDMDLKFQYHKNPDSHCFELHLEPIYSAINDNFEIIQGQFEACRDKVVTLLKDSYHEARAQYIKHKINTSSLPPKIFRVPGYKIPFLDIQVSAFRAEMPAFSYFVPKEVSTASFRVPALGFSVPSYTFVLPSFRPPIIHVPETLGEIRLPSFTLPAVQDIVVIPAMGNITYDFSFKSTVITLNANAGLYNESDIIARFGALSVSVFDVLNGKLDGTTSLTRTRGLKLASTVTLEHSNIKANHECSVSLTKRSMETSAASSVKIQLPFFQMEMSQNLSGNTRTKLSLVSKKKLSYMFNVPQIASVGKGSVDMTWNLEALSSHVLLESSAQGKSDIMTVNILSRNLFLVDLENTVASVVSLRQVFTTVQCKSNNNVQIRHLSMSGTYVVGAELDLVPLKTFKTKVKCEADQLSSLADAGLSQEINIVISSEKQSFSWSLEEHLGSVIHGSEWNIFNEGSEAGMTFSGSVGGNLAFLMSIRLPVYQRTLWDVLGFDEVSNIDDVQFLNFSSAVVYTKNTDGYDYQIPAHLLEDSIMFHLPAFSITLPSWLKEIPHSIRNIDMRLEDVVVPDQVQLPPAVLVPAFHIPQFDIRVSPFTLPKSITIGDLTISLHNITSHISNFKMPTMVIPEQRVEIPEVVLHLPSSIFIPSFGTLSATLNISSPIYKVSTTVSVSNKDPVLESSVSSSCTSTLVFMEYDLTGRTDMIPLWSLKYLLSCSYLWLFFQPLQLLDMTMRCFSCFSSPLQSTPGQDTNILTAKASLRNSDKLVLQTSWSWDSVNDLIMGFKDRIPLMTNALIKFLNKYHTSHFGFDLNRGSVKLRNAVLNLIEKIHREFQDFVSTMQDSVQTTADRGKDTYMKASDILRFTDMLNLTDILMDEVRGGLKHTWHSTDVLLCPVRDFLNNKTLSVPGSGEKMSMMEMFSSVMKGISEQIRWAAFTIPGTDVVLDGNKIMETVKRDVVAMVHHVMEFLQRTLKDVLQLLAEKAEHLRVYVEDQNLKLSPLVQLVHRKIGTFSRQHTDQAQTFVSAYKDLVQLKVHEAYSAFSMERVNSATKGFISTLQSNLSQTVSESLNVMKTVSQSAAPHIRVGKEKLDVEVPLPFLWKSFSEWPTLLRP
uniref:Apolipoprotein B n=1 Tax=Poecilia latipinna TaxID=48699 RepID=A0A3B3UV28_9TELE